MKLIKPLETPFVSTDGKKDYVFDIHVATKHNAKLMAAFTENVGKYIMQCQPNEFNVSDSDVDSVFLADQDLLTITKVGNTYSITTTYGKEFSAGFCYNSTGLQVPSEILVTLSIDKTTISIEFVNTITANFRIVLI